MTVTSGQANKYGCPKVGAKTKSNKQERKKQKARINSKTLILSRTVVLGPFGTI